MRFDKQRQNILSMNTIHFFSNARTERKLLFVLCLSDKNNIVNHRCCELQHVHDDSLLFSTVMNQLGSGCYCAKSLCDNSLGETDTERERERRRRQSSLFSMILGVMYKRYRCAPSRRINSRREMAFQQIDRQSFRHNHEAFARFRLVGSDLCSPNSTNGKDHWKSNLLLYSSTSRQRPPVNWSYRSTVMSRTTNRWTLNQPMMMMTKTTAKKVSGMPKLKHHQQGQRPPPRLVPPLSFPHEIATWFLLADPHS